VRPDHEGNIRTRGLQLRYMRHPDPALGQLDPQQVVRPSREQLPAGGHTEQRVTECDNANRRRRRSLGGLPCLATGATHGDCDDRGKD